MYEIDTKLEALEKAGTPIRVGLIGCGQMGKDIVSQISEMKGMRCNVIVDIDVEIAKDALEQAKYEGEVVVTDSVEEAEAAIDREAVVVT
ncbi:MAG: NAD(P)-dependent oxidoreductase, partial [Blautia sp.]|nr:NAD(P)-dependent oxidoreductase [Blautia sp.]